MRPIERFPARVFSAKCVIILASLFFILPVISPAQDWQNRCDLNLREIVADYSESGIAPEIEDLSKDLAKLSYSAYRLEHTYREKMQRGESRKFDLMGDNEAEVTLEGFVDGKIKLKVKITSGDTRKRSFETTIGITDGGTFVIGGPSFMEGVLLLAFQASL